MSIVYNHHFYKFVERAMEILYNKINEKHYPQGNASVSVTNKEVSTLNLLLIVRYLSGSI